MADMVVNQIPVEIDDVVANLAARKRSHKFRKIGRALWRWMLSLCDWNVSTMNQVPKMDNTVGVAASVSARMIMGPQ